MLPQSTERQKQHLLTCGQPCPGQAQRRGETLTPDHSVGSTQQSRVAGVSLGLGSWGQALSSLLQLPEGDDCHALCVWSQPPDSLPRLDPLTCWYSAEEGCQAWQQPGQQMQTCQRLAMDRIWALHSLVALWGIGPQLPLPPRCSHPLASPGTDTHPT